MLGTGIGSSAIAAELLHLGDAGDVVDIEVDARAVPASFETAAPGLIIDPRHVVLGRARVLLERPAEEPAPELACFAVSSEGISRCTTCPAMVLLSLPWVACLAAGHRADDAERLFARRHRVGQRIVHGIEEMSLRTRRSGRTRGARPWRGRGSSRAGPGSSPRARPAPFAESGHRDVQLDLGVHARERSQVIRSATRITRASSTDRTEEEIAHDRGPAVALVR